MVVRPSADPQELQLEDGPICELCRQPLDGRCIRCEGRACRTCDFCNGCEQILCDACNSDPAMEPQRFPGDRWRHPHNLP